MGKTAHPAPSLDQRLARWITSIPVRCGVLDDADAERYVSLFNATYARKIARPYYQWRYFSPSFKSTAIFADLAGDVRGTIGIQFPDLWLGSRASAAFAVDLMVEPSSRGTGLVFSRLKQEMEREAASSQASVIFLFPNPAGAAAFRSDPQFIEFARKITYLRDTAPLPPSSAPSSLQFEKVPRFGPWTAPLLADFAAGHPELAFVHRSEPYLNWRFAENPLYSYDIFRVHAAGHPFAWLVLKSFTDPDSHASFGDIVDLIWRADSPQPLADILWFALDWFHRRGIPRAAIWLQSNTLLDRVAADLGFAPSSQSRPALIKVLDEKLAWLRDPGRWFLTMSDSEVY